MIRRLLFLLIFSAGPAAASIDHWIAKNSHNQISSSEARRFKVAAFKHGFRYDVDPFLILAVMKVESGFRTEVVSSKGAKGVMQVMPRYHKEKIRGRNLYDLNTGTEVGVMVLAEYIATHKSLERALRAYSGNAPKYARRVMTAMNDLRKAANVGKSEH